MRTRLAGRRLACLTAAFVCALALLLSLTQAQDKPVPGPGGPVPNDPKADNCFLPPLNGLPMLATGVVEFQIPAKPQREFEEGCASLRGQKVLDAEIHLRKAVKQDAKFSAAWVLLGQVLEVEHKMDEAQDACSKPTSLSYLPAYLCLADISARAKNWDDVLRLASLALEIDPSTAAPAYVYNADANFNLHNLAAAEKSALLAIDIDKANKDPHIHFLLAKIYEAKGDRTSEATQLREYLKYVTDPNDAEKIKKALANLGG